VDCPNQRTLSIRKVKEIQAIEEAESKEEYKEDDHTLVTRDVRKLLVIRRVIHAKEVPVELSQREQIFHTW